MADIVELILELRNVSQFVSGSKQASSAAAGIGTETEKAGKKAGAGWKGLAKWAGGAAAIYGATRFVKSAVSATEDLAKATITVSRTTGMDTETSSEWAALMKERGVSTKQFQTSLVKLSKTMESSRSGTVKENSTVKALRAQIDAVSAAGGKKAPAELAKLSKAIATAEGAGAKARSTLDKLGVSSADVAKGNTANVLYKVADALERLHNPAQRAALMQQLFGRSGQALLPILMKGRAGVRKLLEEQKAAGNYISGKGLKSAKDLIKQQRALETAFAGVKVQLGQALLPVLVQVGKILVRFMTFIRPLTKNATLFKIAIGLLAVAFVAYKIAMIAATIATTVFDTAAAPVVGIVLGIIAAVALLAFGIYELWKHCKTFRDIVHAVWGWLKSNWPKLLAIIRDPVKAALELIVKAFGVARAAAVAVYDWVKTNWPYLVAVLAGPVGIAAVVIAKHFDAIKAAAGAALAWVKSTAAAVFGWLSRTAGAVSSTVSAAFTAAGATVGAAFGAIKAAALAVFGWIRANWPLLLGALAGPFGLAVAVIATHFGTIKSAAAGVLSAVRSTFSSIGSAISSPIVGAVAAIRQAIDNLVGYVSSIPDKVGGALKSIPVVGGAASAALSGAGKVASIFHRQHGGPVPAGGVALVGERGPELVHARTALTVTPLAQPELAGAGAGAPSFRPLEIVVPVMLDRRELARAVARVGSDQLARR